MFLYSDGVIRVFTNNPDRMASAEDIKAFEEQVSASEIPTQVGDIDCDKLPGDEALFEPGTHFLTNHFCVYFGKWVRICCVEVHTLIDASVLFKNQ